MGDSSVPTWVAAVSTSIPVLATATFIGFKIWLKGKKARRDDQTDADTAEHERCELQERSSAQEAWAEVDRLKIKVDAIEAREEQCEKERAEERVEHATHKAVTSVLIEWAMKQKNPPPIPVWLIERLKGNSGEQKPE